MTVLWKGAVILIAFIVCPLLIYPGSPLHRITVSSMTRKQTLLFLPLILALITASTYLMTLGEKSAYLAQYEEITESFVKGKLYRDVETDPNLMAMDNPYDPEARIEADAYGGWDWAFYNGRFYMYFGVVPVLLVFMPYRLLFGHPPATVHASQLFAALYILGLMAFLFYLAVRKFRKMTAAQLQGLLFLLSAVSLLYVIKFPALYQTPVACGLFLEICSLLCFTSAVWENWTEKTALRMAMLGSLLGALVFGCRPPLALANLLVFPLLTQFLKGRKMHPELAARMAAAASPYALVAAGLMIYNAARFDNPFEFGQAYQITLADQTKLGNVLDPINWVKVPVEIINNLFALPKLETSFPFLTIGMGAFCLCPLLLCGFLCLTRRSRQELKSLDLKGFSIILFLTVLLIIAIQAIWTPGIWDRYKSDYLWLLCLQAFLSIGLMTERAEDTRRISLQTSLGCLICLGIIVLVFLIPDDCSYTDCFPEVLEQIRKLFPSTAGQ